MKNSESCQIPLLFMKRVVLQPGIDFLNQSFTDYAFNFILKSALLHTRKKRGAWFILSFVYSSLFYLYILALLYIIPYYAHMYVYRERYVRFPHTKLNVPLVIILVKSIY